MVPDFDDPWLYLAAGANSVRKEMANVFGSLSDRCSRIRELRAIGIFDECVVLADVKVKSCHGSLVSGRC
jgi:hypothetical protein